MREYTSEGMRERERSQIQYTFSACPTLQFAVSVLSLFSSLFSRLPCHIVHPANRPHYLPTPSMGFFSSGYQRVHYPPSFLSSRAWLYEGASSTLPPFYSSVSFPGESGDGLPQSVSHSIGRCRSVLSSPFPPALLAATRRMHTMRAHTRKRKPS